MNLWRWSHHKCCSSFLCFTRLWSCVCLFVCVLLMLFVVVFNWIVEFLWWWFTFRCKMFDAISQSYRWNAWGINVDSYHFPYLTNLSIQLPIRIWKVYSFICVFVSFLQFNAIKVLESSGNRKKKNERKNDGERKQSKSW